MTSLLKTSLKDHRGFTLIEIVVTIIISAILAVILAQVMTNQTWRGYWPLQTYDNSLALKQAMENITSDYKELLRTDPTPLATLQSQVVNHDYWDVSVPMQISANYCLTLDEAGETPNAAACTPADTVLKLTLSYGEQSLTALFTLIN